MEIEKVCLPLKTNLQSIVRFDPIQALAGAKKGIFGLKSFARTYQMELLYGLHLLNNAVKLFSKAKYVYI